MVKQMDNKHYFTKVVPDSLDWEAWYMDGKLIAEGHNIDGYHMLDAIADVFQNSVDCKFISDEIAEKGFPCDLNDLLL